MDPEVPVLSVIDLGVVRNIEVTSDTVAIDVTPTYSGCPAMDTIIEDITDCLQFNGISNPIVKTTHNEVWTTDWISESGRKKLEDYGIAPPAYSAKSKRSLSGENEVVKCPQCKSIETELISFFGSTACKSLYKCNSCSEPFDYFKCI